MTNYTAPTPSPQFIHSTKAAIAYWHRRTQAIDDNAISQLDFERQNLFQAVQFGLALPQTLQEAAIVALQAFNLVERRGYWEEWIPVLEQAATFCTDKQLHLKFELLSRLGQLQRFSQQLSTAIETHREAENLAQQLGHKQSLAIAYCNLSEDYLRCHDYATTERYGQAALAALNNLEGMKHWEAITLNTLGEVARVRDNLAMSEEMLSKGVAIRRKLAQPIFLMRALNNLAVTLQTAQKFNSALQSYEEASELLAATSYELDKAVVQINLGALYSRLEQWDKAETILRQVNLTHLRQSNTKYHEAATMQGLGNVLVKQHQPDEAIPYLQHAITLWQTIGEGLEQANSMETLGEAHAAQGQVAEAIPLYQEAIALLKKFPGNARAQKLMAEFKLDLQRLVEEQQIANQ